MFKRFGILKYKPRLILLFIGILLFANNRPKMKGKKKKIKNIPYYEILELLI